MSVTEAVFVTSINFVIESWTTVGSLTAAVVGSSLKSVTSFVFPGELAVTETVLIIYTMKI